MLDSSITSLPSTSETNVKKSTMHETPSTSLPSSLETNAKTSAAPEHKNSAAVVEILSSSSSPLSSPPPSPTQVDSRETLSLMGFSEKDINLGLKESDGDVSGAVDYLLGYPRSNKQSSDAQEVIKHQSKTDSEGPSTLYPIFNKQREKRNAVSKTPAKTGKPSDNPAAIVAGSSVPTSFRNVKPTRGFSDDQRQELQERYLTYYDLTFLQIAQDVLPVEISLDKAGDLTDILKAALAKEIPVMDQKPYVTERVR